MAGQPSVYHTIPETLARDAALSVTRSIGLRNVRILYNGEPSGFDEFERLRSEDDGASGFEVIATAIIKVQDLSRGMAAEQGRRTQGKQTLVSLRLRFALAEVAYVVDKYMKKNEDTMVIISTLGALCSTIQDPWRYFHIESPIRALDPETYLHSRLTLDRYNTWRFVFCACRGYKLPAHMKRRMGPRRTIEWLVDAFYCMYGKTHDGTRRGHPVRRADVRSMLAAHALWLRPRLQRLVKIDIWAEWCEDIPRIRAAAARQGIVWGRMRALAGDPLGRTYLEEDPEDRTTTMRADERRRIDELVRESGGLERDRDASPARERRQKKTLTQRTPRRRSPSPPTERSPPRSRHVSQSSRSSRSDVRSARNKVRATAPSRSPSLGPAVSDDEVQIISPPMSVNDRDEQSPPPEIISSPGSWGDHSEDEQSPPPESPSARPTEEPWELLVLTEFPFLANLPELPVGYIWTCPFENCHYTIDMYEPQARAEELLLKNRLWDEFGPPAEDNPALKTRARKVHKVNPKQERYRRFMQEHHLGLSLGCEEERERLFEVLVYMHWARDLFYMGHTDASKLFFEASKAKCDAAADSEGRTLSPVV
ncbi:hypothetical protein AURDEDRAFT_187818 [Auricularia subglabra TFB-10046 SS5]|nr:hypothetical protein AURDEDRAFT_187818 [Auricularia subglabra TFB-10046 SS5]